MGHVMMRAMNMLCLLAAAEAFSTLRTLGGAVSGRFVRLRGGEHLRAHKIVRTELQSRDDGAKATPDAVINVRLLGKR